MPQSFAREVEKFVKDEPILGIVVGEHYRRAGSSDGKVVKWSAARPLLDYSYRSGFGGTDCHPIHLWTPTSVVFVAAYDGSTWLASVPRNPTDSEPVHVGGE